MAQKSYIVILAEDFVNANALVIFADVSDNQNISNIGAALMGKVLHNRLRYGEDRPFNDHAIWLILKKSNQLFGRWNSFLRTLFR